MTGILGDTGMPTFIDLFAGCGGLSLGLVRAGWVGRFAVERHPDAYATLSSNLLGSGQNAFVWPRWLKRQAWDIEDLLNDHLENLRSIAQTVDLIAGGPPCQGYSLAGRRDPSDKRNTMVDRYLEMVDIVQPKFLLLENVTGFTSGFVESADDGSSVRGVSPSSDLIARLESRGFAVSSQLLNCADWGVPQRRNRFIAIGVKREVFRNEKPINVMRVLRGLREVFLASKGLPSDRPVSVIEAIEDLETNSALRVPDSEHPRFDMISYVPPTLPSAYVKLMRSNFDGAPCSLRLPQHRENTVARFREVLRTCSLGRTLTASDRSRLKSKKHAFTPLAPNCPAPTVTTLPDDMIHYREPRILTVREMARLQSFPDSYVFKGKYTTGGPRRKLDCPRYTQVGNAVPPLVGEALGIALRAVIALSKTDAGYGKLVDLEFAVS